VWDRRAFATALALVLAGCATIGTQETTSRNSTDGQPNGDGNTVEYGEYPWMGSSDARPQHSPREPWPDGPDLVVLNHKESSLTVWITVQGSEWEPPVFQETVSIRNRRPGMEPIGVAVDDVPVVGAYSTVEFETAFGRHASYRWYGGDSPGVRAHVYPDDIRFSTVAD
jgi:hypothetical protein